MYFSKCQTIDSRGKDKEDKLNFRLCVYECVTVFVWVPKYALLSSGANKPKAKAESCPRKLAFTLHNYWRELRIGFAKALMLVYNHL